MDIPDWLSHHVKDPAPPTPAARKRIRKRKVRPSLAAIKAEWASCIVVDEMNPESIDWLIARIEQLERRLAKRRDERG